MKKITYVIACTAFSLWLGACSGPRNTTTDANGNDVEMIEDEAEEKAEDVKDEAKEAGKDVEKAADKAGDKAEDAADEASDKVEDTAEKAGNAAENAADEAGDEMSEERKAFSSETREKVQLLDQKINQLSEKIEQAGDKAKVNMKEDLAELKTKRSKLNDELGRLEKQDKDNDGNAWQEIKSGVSSAFSDLESTYNRIEKKLTDN